MFWLDWLLWGNGHGYKSPSCNDVFYWIDGRWYNTTGWFGCQIWNIQWTRPPAGTKREILGRDFEIFRTERRFLRVACYWSMVGINRLTIDDSNAEINKFRQELKDI